MPMEAISKLRVPQVDRFSMTLAGDRETIECEIDSVTLESLRIWDLQLSPGHRLVGVLRFPDGVVEWIRGEVLFAGSNSGRSFTTIKLRSETWEGFLALVRHRAGGAPDFPSPIAA